MKIGNTDVYFYFLIELQSSVDYTMPFRLLKYMVALLDDIFQNTPEEIRSRKGFRIPAVVPVIFYNGDDYWTQVRRFREYTKNAEVFGDCIIDFCYLLFDLKRTDNSALSSPEQLLDAVFSFDKERLMGTIQDENFTELWEEKTNKLPDDDKFTLFGWLLHIMYNGVANDEINKIFENTIKKGQKNTMKHSFEVWADELHQRFMSEGAKEKALEIAKNLRERGMSVDDVANITKLTVDDILKL